MNRQLLLIAGPSCSGKSSLAQCLVSLGATALTADDYYFETDPSEIEHTNFDLPDAIDHRRLGEDTAQLLLGQEISAPIYGFNVCRPVGTRQVRPSSLIVVEGQYAALYPSLLSLNPTIVLLDESKERCLARRIHRDAQILGRDPHSTTTRFETHTWPIFSSFLPQLRQVAHLRLSETTVESALRSVCDRLALDHLEHDSYPFSVERHA